MKVYLLSYTRFLLPAILVLCFLDSHGQKLPKTLILTGNGNLSSYKREYPPWIHEFQNEKVVEILRGVSSVHVTSDLNVLQKDQLKQYDLIISNSLFLTPDKDQLEALYDFVSNGKSYFTIHCGILSLLNWDKYEDFIGGIFIGGPSSVPAEFKVITANTEFWGYDYSFRKQTTHPVSIASDDFVIKDELYHFQPSTKDLQVIARAENLPVMWWHPVGKGKVMSLTLGHDEEAKNNPGYQELLTLGVRWLTDTPILYGERPQVVSTRVLVNENFMTLKAATDLHDAEQIRFDVTKVSSPELFAVSSTETGNVTLRLSGKTGSGTFVASASGPNGFSSTRTFSLRVAQDGVGNIAAYHGNMVTCSSNENTSAVFAAVNVSDGDPTTRWSSAPTDSVWIKLDLLKVYPVSKLVLRWESSYAKAYQVQGSRDGKTWSVITTIKEGDGETDTVTFAPANIRYVQILGTERANLKWGYSLYEIEVYQ